MKSSGERAICPSRKVVDPHDVSAAVLVLVMWLAGGWGSAVPGLREVSFR
jgi:hypothetical protein